LLFRFELKLSNISIVLSVLIYLLLAFGKIHSGLKSLIVRKDGRIAVFDACGEKTTKS
jgi:hypothetical protein